MTKRKIALFGGTFDPIHLGHIRVASFTLDKLGAELIIIIPAKRSPLKVDSPIAGDDDRINMIKLATSNVSGFEVSDFELKKEPPSYTLNTIKHFQEKYPDSQLYWLIGADNINDLPAWYKIETLIDECFITTMCRPGFDKPDFSKFAELWGSERTKKLQGNIIETPLVDISSTEVRARLTQGMDVSDMLDSDVADYIKKNNLYMA